MVRHSCPTASCSGPMYVTAEINYSTVHARQEVLACSWGTCLVTRCFVHYACKKFTRKAMAAMAPGLHWSGIMVIWGYIMATLWLCHGYLVAAVAAATARREWTCLQFLWLLESPSSLLAHTLPTLGSANSVNTKTIDVMSGIRDTTGVDSRIPSR